MAELKDSGERREFESGAVRDLQQGKGRCDLLPLKEVSMLLSEDGLPGDDIISDMHIFLGTKNPGYLFESVRKFAKLNNVDLYSVVLDVAKQFEDGAIKYGENNWRKGIPVHCYIDSGIRHLLKHLRGDKDEPHDRAFCWNMLCCVWTMRNHPGLIDI